MEQQQAKTVEQLQAELKAAEEAVAAAQAAEKQAKWEAEQAAAAEQRKAHQEKQSAAKRSILEKIAAECGTLPLRTDGERLLFGVDSRVHLEDQYVKGSSAWRSRATGNFIVCVSRGYESAGRFPPLKNGGHNYAKIAERMAEIAQQQAAGAKLAAEKAALVSSAAEIVARLQRDFPSHESNVKSSLSVSYPRGGGSRYEYVEHAPKEGHVFLALGNRQFTEEQARVVLAALKSVEEKSNGGS